MTGPELPGDEALLARLGEVAARVDPPTPLLAELGRALFGLRRLDQELAALVADSAAEPAGVRGPAPGFRLLSFHTGALTVEVQVSGSGATSRVLGELVWEGVTGATLSIETTSGAPVVVPVDADGRFELAPAPRAVMRFRVAADDGRTVSTAWVRI